MNDNDISDIGKLELKSLNLSDTFQNSERFDDPNYFKSQVKLFKNLMNNETINEFIFQNNFIPSKNFLIMLETVINNKNIRCFDISFCKNFNIFYSKSLIKNIR